MLTQVLGRLKSLAPQTFVASDVELRSRFGLACGSNRIKICILNIYFLQILAASASRKQLWPTTTVIPGFIRHLSVIFAMKLRESSSHRDGKETSEKRRLSPTRPLGRALCRAPLGATQPVNYDVTM